ncbi:hypothetical protein MPTK1_1g05160 [Marchantia polymorpha subsp. ruderalis]|uniref:Uncharacterized protein n=1 Tax=Marchantia polymorpha subsp. ruderalis TaxID=1480154 RepID=A0AAF6ALP0_MARPO|nr:hypothetical protein Mp_1g05160 [Marchantia polymorpha subsp. ruderalis]
MKVGGDNHYFILYIYYFDTLNPCVYWPRPHSTCLAFPWPVLASLGKSVSDSLSPRSFSKPQS